MTCPPGRRAWPGTTYALACLTLLPPLPATAGQEDYSHLEELQVTASRQAQSSVDVATAVTVVGQDQLERDLPRVLPDLLRGQPGVFVQQTTPGQGSPIIRGLKGSEVLHLVDGMRLNNAMFRNAPTQYMALVDPRNVERLEVVRGPSSTLYGSDAMGGVVHVITPVPAFAEDDSWLSARARVDLGSAESLRAGRFSATGARRKLAWTAGLSWQETGDRHTGGGSIGPTGYRSRAGDAKLLFAPAQDHELMLSLQYLEQPATPRVDDLVPGFGQAEADSELFLFEPNRRVFGHLRYSLVAPLAFMDRLDINLARQKVVDDRRSRATGSRTQRHEDNESVLDGLTVQASSATGGMRFTYGAEWYFDEVSSARDETDLDTGARMTVGSRFPDGSSIDSLALFLNNEIRITSGSTLTAGMRLSRFEIDLAPADRGVGAKLDIDDLTGNVGLNIALSPALHLVSNAGRGFRPPNIFDLGTLGERPGNRFNIANPALQPESVQTVDAGLKFRNQRVRGEIFVFKSSYSDKITSVATGEVTDDGRQIVQSRNVSELELVGFETGVRIAAGDKLEMSANLTWTRGEERGPDGMITPGDRIPPLNGRIGAMYHGNERFWAEAFLRFAAQQDRLSPRDAEDPRIDPGGTPGWATANLRFGWDPDPRWRITLGLYNLTDRRFREHGSGIDGPGFDAAFSVAARFE